MLLACLPRRSACGAVENDCCVLYCTVSPALSGFSQKQPASSTESELPLPVVLLKSADENRFAGC